jgi:hypothetical protein
MRESKVLPDPARSGQSRRLHKSETEGAHRKMLGFSQTPSAESIFAGMANILENVPGDQEEPKLIVRKAPHAAVWSVWAVLEGTPSGEIFEGSSEEEAVGECPLMAQSRHRRVHRTCPLRG